MSGAPLPRRTFVRRLPVLGAGIAGGLSALSLSGCGGTTYLAPSPGPEGLTVPLVDAESAGSAFLQTAGMERPIYLSREASGEWTAVLASCTHRGCQPEPLGQRLICPCHGSEFAFTGEVLQGPADRPLTRYPVTQDGPRLVVHTGGDER